MKIDRLLSIVIYLLNRDLVSARELAAHFEVSVRTIQRDMDALGLAGIPIVSMQGAQGGFGIIEGYKLDRQLIDSGDLFFILTALESIGSTLKNKKIAATLEKIKTLVGDYQAREINQQKDKLYIDFSAFSIGKNSSDLFYLLDESIEKGQVIQFRYTDSGFRISERQVEPITIVFKWFAWYLFGFCRLRNDFRLFRLSRMENIQVTPHRFKPRNVSFYEFSRSRKPEFGMKFINLKLRFHPVLRVIVEDYFASGEFSTDDAGYIIVKIRFPEDEWLYSTILSYGDKVEVLEPVHIRNIMARKARMICEVYEKNDSIPNAE